MKSIQDVLAECEGEYERAVMADNVITCLPRRTLKAVIIFLRQMKNNTFDNDESGKG